MTKRKYVNARVKVPLALYDAAVKALKLSERGLSVFSGRVLQDGTVVLVTRLGEHRWKKKPVRKRKAAGSALPAPKPKKG